MIKKQRKNLQADLEHAVLHFFCCGSGVCTTEELELSTAEFR